MIGTASRGVPIKVLLIEDDERVAELFAGALAEAGHEPSVCHTGREGLAAFRASRPDVVFLDVRMPGMSGIEVLRVIRETDETVPVIIVTGHATTKEMEEARRLGVAEILEKPYILNEFTSALGRIGSFRRD